MTEIWDVKVIGDSEGDIEDVIARVMNALGVAMPTVTIARYPKFPRMWTCDFRLDSRTTDPIAECQSRVRLLSTPIWEDDSTETPGDGGTPDRRRYEAIADARKHPLLIPEVFWINVSCDAPSPRAAKSRPGGDEE